jgi:hypothetical protein
MNDRQIEIRIDVRWSGEDIPHGLTGAYVYRPAYRIYVDSDLLTERTYVWQHEDTYVEELITVKLGPGAHRLKVEKLNDPRDMLRISNVRINDQPANFEFSI